MRALRVIQASGVRAALLGTGLAGGALLASCADWIDPRVELETFERTEPVDGVTALDVDVDYNVGRFELRPAGGDDLYSIDLTYDRLHFEPELRMDRSGSAGSLRFELGSRSNGFSGRTFENDLVMELNEEVTLDLTLSMGVAESYIDLTGMRTERLRFNGGVGRAELAFHAPGPIELERMDIGSGVGEIDIHGIGNARVRDLRFSGGVGSAELDFSGEWEGWATTVDVSVGVGKIDITVPRELPVEIRSSDSFLSNIDAPSFTRAEGRYTRNLTGVSRPQLVIRIDSGIGGVDVNLR